MAIYVDDRELVAAHRAGEKDAFDELVREHRMSLHNHARRKLNCDAGAEDAVQETFVRAYRALPNFNGQYRLGPWLHRIMSNVCIDEANRRNRDGDKTNRLASQPATRTNSPGIEEQLGLQLDDTRLRSALEDLPASHREALVLRFVDDLDYGQVAEASGVSEQNARARVSRARSAMRAAMKGVAALPALLLGLMKRGEKAAAAATAGSTATAATATASSVSSASAVLPTLTEATVAAAHVAPSAIPIVAKAAVGLGLAAAVFTPTSDSAVHLAAEALVSPPVIAESDAEIDSVSSSGSNDQGVVIASQSSADAEGSDGETGTGAEATLETMSPSETQSAAIAGPSSSEEIVVERPSAVLVTGVEGSIAAVDFEAHMSAEGQYDLAGDARFAVGGMVFAGSIDAVSRIQIGDTADSAGRKRFEALIATSDQFGMALAEIRLTGFVADDASTVARISGLFRADSEAMGLLSRGTFSGTLGLGSQIESGSLDIQFEQ